MARISGHGSDIIVTDANDELLGTQHSTDFEIDVEAMLDECTDSESVSADAEPIITKVNSCVINCVDKDDSYPELIGLTVGARVSLYFRRGTGSDYDWVQNTIVRSIRKSNPQTGLRRLTVTTEYGTYIPNTPL